MPISIRFETSAKEVFYAALAAKLAPIYGESVNYQTLSAEQWKGVCDTYLQQSPPHGQRLVVVIDGLDEAAGWQPGASFIPLPVPSTIRIVASARVQAEKEADGWLDELGWQSRGTAFSMALNPLDRAGVQSVLIKMGNPLDGFAHRVDVVGKLMELTEGDPLLIRLYVDALVGSDRNPGFIEPNQLAGMEAKGLKGYFNRWWIQQQRQWKFGGQNPLETQKEVDSFFYAVATAFGPLSTEDVLAVAKSDGVTKRRLKEIAQSVGRFVIGDGETRGYTFSHPRLGYYFFELLDNKEQRAWNDRYVQYGARILQALQQSGLTAWTNREIHAYAYVVEYYVAHLERGKAEREAYYALICHEWAQACEVLHGTYDSFLGDVAKVWQQAQDDPDIVRGMTMQVWCALCQSSVVGLSTNLLPILIVGALQYGVLSKAQVVVLIRQNNNEHRKHATIMGLLINPLGVADDKTFLQQLLEMGRTLQNGRYSEEILIALAPHLPGEVLEVARTWRSSGLRMRVLIALAPHLPSEVLEVARTLPVDVLGLRAEILIALAPHLPSEVLEVGRTLQNGRYSEEILIALAPHLPGEVLEVARTWRSSGLSTRVLVALAPHLPDSPRIYREALDIARALETDGSRAEILIALAPHLPGEVLEVARTLQDDDSRAEVLIALAPHLPGEVLEVARTWRSSGLSTRVLIALAPHLPSEVLEVARTLQDDGSRAEVLIALAPYLPSEVLEVARTFQGSGSGVEILSALAPHLPNEVLEMTRTLEADSSRAEVLIALAPRLPSEVLEVARTLQDTRYNSWVLSVLAPFLPDSPSIYHEALEVARNLQDDDARARVLCTLALDLPSEVLEVARNLQGNGSRAEILIALAPHLPDSPSIYCEALEVARAIEDEWSHAEILKTLAPHMPSEVLEVVRALQVDSPRADVMRALAPHLPSEVLEVARALEDYVYQAEVLRALAPHLPSKVLEMARTWRDDRSQARVLSALVSHLPSEAFDVIRTWRDDHSQARVLSALAPHLPSKVLEMARTLETDSSRAEVLSALAPHLPSEVLEVARTLETCVYQAEVLSALAPHLPSEVLEVARTLPVDVFGSRAEVMCFLAPFLPDSPSIYHEALEVARNLQDNDARARVLRTLAPHLPSEVLEVARTLQDDGVRARVLRTLSPHLPSEVLEVARTLQNDSFGYGAEILIALGLHLPSEVLEVARTLQDARYRAKVLRELAIPLTGNPKSKERWNQTIVLGATRPRSDLLSDLAALMPLTLSLANALSHPSRVHALGITLTPTQFTDLLNLMQSLPLTSTSHRIHFLDTLGIPLALRNTVHFDVPQNAFIYNLLNTLIHASPMPDGTSYLATLLRYLHDVEWAGQETHRAFVAELLGTAPDASPRQRLAQGILDAVQTVCTWWP